MTSEEECSKAVVTAFTKIDGVKDVKIDFDKKIVRVRFDSAKTDKDKLGKAVEGTKYTLSSTDEKIEDKK